MRAMVVPVHTFGCNACELCSRPPSLALNASLCSDPLPAPHPISGEIFNKDDATQSFNSSANKYGLLSARRPSRYLKFGKLTDDLSHAGTPSIGSSCHRFETTDFLEASDFPGSISDE